MLVDDRQADGPQYFVEIGFAMLAMDLMDDHQLLPLVDFQRERRAQIDCLVSLPDGPFDVVRIVVVATDDDQVLEPSRHVQLAVQLKTEIAGTQEAMARAVAVLVAVG